MNLIEKTLKDLLVNRNDYKHLVSFLEDLVLGAKHFKNGYLNLIGDVYSFDVFKQVCYSFVDLGCILVEQKDLFSNRNRYQTNNYIYGFTYMPGNKFVRTRLVMFENFKKLRRDQNITTLVNLVHGSSMLAKEKYKPYYSFNYEGLVLIHSK